MPDPMKLKLGDRIRFVSLPDEWNDPHYFVHQECIEFMKAMISRSWPSRIYEIDEYGTPWIAARIRKGGRIEHHIWAIFEETGWRFVRRRAR